MLFSCAVNAWEIHLLRSQIRRSSDERDSAEGKITWEVGSANPESIDESKPKAKLYSDVLKSKLEITEHKNEIANINKTQNRKDI